MEKDKMNYGAINPEQWDEIYPEIGERARVRERAASLRNTPPVDERRELSEVTEFPNPEILPQVTIQAEQAGKLIAEQTLQTETSEEVTHV